MGISQCQPCFSGGGSFCTSTCDSLMRYRLDIYPQVRVCERGDLIVDILASVILLCTIILMSLCCHAVARTMEPLSAGDTVLDVLSCVSHRLAS